MQKSHQHRSLEPSIGFLHEFSDYQTKQSLVYDLQEPYRWIGDVTVIEALESGVLDLKDFYFLGDDYRYRLEENAKKTLSILTQRTLQHRSQISRINLQMGHRHTS